MNNPTRRTALFFAVFLVFSMAFASAFDLGDWMKGLFRGGKTTGFPVESGSGGGSAISVILASYNFSDGFGGASYTGAVIVNEGIDGKAASFDGTDDYAKADLNMDRDNFTLSFWFNTKDAKSIKRIVEHQWYASPADGGVFTTHINNGKVYAGLTMNDKTQPFVGTISTIEANKWYQYILTYDGSTAKVYLDGILQSSLAINKPIKKTTKSLVIGGASGVSFNGSIDEVFVYKRALSADDIRKIYDGERSRLVIAPTPGTGGGGGGGGTVVELKDRCSELSDSLKTNMSRVKEQAKKNGYNFVMEEGINLSLYDYIMVYSINSPNKARILQLVSIGGGTSSIDKTTFQDVNTVESFDFTTGVSNVSTRNIDGYTFYVATLSKFGSGISAIITWGDGASYGNVGKQKDTFDCSVPEPPAECKDSDGGKDYYVKGVLNGGLEDYCMSDLLSVREYYCDSSVKEGFSNEFYKCPNGCKDGACVKAGVEGEEYINLAISSKKLYMGDSINAAKTTLVSSDLPNLLADGYAVDIMGAIYNYVQTIKVGDSKVSLGSSNEVLIQIGDDPRKPLFNYTLTFVKGINVTDTINFVNVAKLKILGKDYIVAGGESNSLYLISEGNGADVSIDEEETKTVSISGGEHTVTLKGTTSTTSATIVVDGVQKSVNKGGTYKFSGGIEVYIKDVYHATKTGTLSHVGLIAGKELMLHFVNGEAVKVGADEVSLLGTNVEIFDYRGKIYRLSISQAAESITNDHIPVGGEYVDRVFGGDLRVRFESYDSNTKMAEILLGKFITPIKPPTPPQVCSELVDKVKNPSTFSDLSDNKWYLSWNNSYEGSWWVDNKEISYNSYYAAWSNSYYNSNENLYNYLSINLMIFDDKNIDTEKLLKEEITNRVCQVNNYNDDIVYICNWNVLRNEQSSDGQTQYKSREVLWSHKNILVRMNLNINQYLNDEQLRNLVEQTTQQFLKDLKSNDYKYSIWKDFDIQYPLSTQLYDALDSCPSTLSKETCSPYWSCKIEPAICPPHGEQKQICRDSNRCNDQEIQEQTVSCSPGICSGCYVPKWYGGSDNKCIPYGFRFEHDTQGDIRVFEDQDTDRLQEGKDFDDSKVIVLSDTEAIVFLPLKDRVVNYTVKEGQSVDLTEAVVGIKRGNDEEIISATMVVEDIVYSGSQGEDNYVVLTFKAKVQGHDVKKVNAYCDIDGQIKLQKLKDSGGEWASCQNNYECESNVCSGGQCVEVNDIIKDAKGIKVLLFKALCRITNLFSDDGYKQCLIENLGTGTIEPPVSSEVDLSSSKYLINKKFERLKADEFIRGNVEPIDDIVSLMPNGFIDGEAVAYINEDKGRGNEPALWVLVLEYNRQIGFDEFDNSIGDKAREEFGLVNVKYEEVEGNRKVLAYKEDEVADKAQGFVWVSGNYVIWAVTTQDVAGHIADNVIQDYYNKYISSLEGEDVSNGGDIQPLSISLFTEKNRYNVGEYVGLK